MKAADAALFGASWWPYASYETLKIATYLSIWVRIVTFLSVTLRFISDSQFASFSHGTMVRFIRGNVAGLIQSFPAESDSAEFSNLITDLVAAQKFRTETINYARKCLEGDKEVLDKERPSSTIIASFRPVGEAIAEHCTAGETSTPELAKAHHAHTSQQHKRRPFSTS